MAEELGQVPQSGQVPTTTTATQDGGNNAPQAGANQNQAETSQEGTLKPGATLEEIIADLRKENAKHRTRNKALEADLNTLKQAALSEDEKKAAEWKRLTELDASWQTERTNLTLRLELERAAVKAGTQKPDAVYKLADTSAIEFEDGHPTQDSIKAAIEAVKTDYPELFKPLTAAPPSVPSTGNSVNGRGQGKDGSGGVGGTQITKEKLLKMSNAEVAALWASGEMQKAIDAGLLKQ